MLCKFTIKTKEYVYNKYLLLWNKVRDPVLVAVVGKLFPVLKQEPLPTLSQQNF